MNAVLGFSLNCADFSSVWRGHHHFHHYHHHDQLVEGVRVRVKFRVRVIYQAEEDFLLRPELGPCYVPRMVMHEQASDC